MWNLESIWNLLQKAGQVQLMMKEEYLSMAEPRPLAVSCEGEST